MPGPTISIYFPDGKEDLYEVWKRTPNRLQLFFEFLEGIAQQDEEYLMQEIERAEKTAIQHRELLARKIETKRPEPMVVKTNFNIEKFTNDMKALNINKGPDAVRERVDEKLREGVLTEADCRIILSQVHRYR
jgi:ribosomal protein L16 Arg81 hydroxylase